MCYHDIMHTTTPKLPVLYIAMRPAPPSPSPSKYTVATIPLKAPLRHLVHFFFYGVYLRFPMTNEASTSYSRLEGEVKFPLLIIYFMRQSSLDDR